MPRKPDPTRKPELLGQILDHLVGRTLATVSFRTLAEALGVSTYVFVYHFGNRAQLIDEIVRAIVSRQARLLSVDASTLDAAAFRAFLDDLWPELSSDRNLQLQRLEFEAAMLEVVDGVDGGTARAGIATWRQFASTWAAGRGTVRATAEVEASLFADGVFGALYDALASGDVERAGRVFAAQVDRFVVAAGG